jgi:hypothetical protein
MLVNEDHAYTMEKVEVKNCTVHVASQVDEDRKRILGLRKSCSCPAFFISECESKQAYFENTSKTLPDGFQSPFHFEDSGDNLPSPSLSTVSHGEGLSAKELLTPEVVDVVEYEVAITNLACVLCSRKESQSFDVLRTVLEQCARNVQCDLRSCQSFEIAICILFLELRKSVQIFNYMKLYIFVEWSDDVLFLNSRGALGQLEVRSRESVLSIYQDLSKHQRKRMLAIHVNKRSQCPSLDLILCQKQRSVAELVEQTGGQVHGNIRHIQFMRFWRQSARYYEWPRAHRPKQSWVTCMCIDCIMTVCDDSFVGLNLWMANEEIFLYRPCDTMLKLTREALLNQGADNFCFANICLNGWFVYSRLCGKNDKEPCGDQV